MPLAALLLLSIVLLLVAASQWRARRRVEAELGQREDELGEGRVELARRDEQNHALAQELSRRSSERRDLATIARELMAFTEVSAAKEMRALYALREEIHAGLGKLEQQLQDPDRFRAELQREFQPVLRGANDAAALRQTLRELLAPMVARDRLGRELSELAPATSLAELPALLDAIAAKGGFSTVVLSDDVGLPLAANSNARGVDALAGMASFFLRLADRAELDGTARPQAVVALDHANQHVLHRIFAVDAKWFTLSAISRGIYVSPGALDVALGKFERTLGDHAA